MSWITKKENGLVLTLRVVPRSSKNKIDGLLGEALKVRIQAPPVEGKANAYLLKFLASSGRFLDEILYCLRERRGAINGWKL